LNIERTIYRVRPDLSRDKILNVLHSSDHPATGQLADEMSRCPECSFHRLVGVSLTGLGCYVA